RSSPVHGPMRACVSAMCPFRRELGDEGTSRLLEHHVRGDAAFDDSLELHPVRGMRTLWPGRRTVPQQEVSAKGQRYPVASVCTQPHHDQVAAQLGGAANPGTPEQRGLAILRHRSVHFAAGSRGHSSRKRRWHLSGIGCARESELAPERQSNAVTLLLPRRIPLSGREFPALQDELLHAVAEERERPDRFLCAQGAVEIALQDRGMMLLE